MKKIGLIVVGIIVILGGVLLYLNHMNYWPFHTDKEKGIPDGEIKNMNQLDRTDELSLLLAASGKVGYNVKGSNVSIYFDVYKRDKRVLHKLVTEFGSEKDTQLSGTLVWGIPGFDVFKPTEIRAAVSNDGATSQDSFAIPKDVFGKIDNAGAQTQPFEDGKIKKGKKYILQGWIMGKENIGMNEDTFSEKGFKNQEQTVMLYVVFK
ncbi:hypothetical protein HCA99_01730 [Listeria booriae]|uniref:hypothetical protein n=1 Tax=Listeria booriae TaxID=1552123 RepID=UPI0016256DA4|nr:hypothetical protein [Listeria booriae]MBC2020115.1 hypothetical protein [Listeria booriae]MBC2077932.1 hypothetical protein [Listeria booriae]